MKSLKAIISSFMALIIITLLCLTCFAYDHNHQSSWLTLTGSVFDENYGVTILSNYSCAFTLNTNTGNMAYSFNISPVSIGGKKARSKLVYKLKRLNDDYSTLYSNYINYYLPYTSDPLDFEDYFYTHTTHSNNTTLINSYTGSLTTSTTSVSENVSMSVSYFYYYDIDFDSLYQSQFYGDENFDIVCIAESSFNYFHYYY